MTLIVNTTVKSFCLIDLHVTKSALLLNIFGTSGTKARSIKLTRDMRPHPPRFLPQMKHGMNAVSVIYIGISVC